MCQNTRANVPGTLRKRDCIVQGNRDKACMKQADMPSPVPMITGSGLPSTSSPTFVARQAGSSNATACPLSCQNGGNCDSDLALGEPTCICPPGFTGDLCEIIKEQRCGQDTCYHGSECVAASNGGLFCDCSTIGDPVRHYAGKFCQFETTLYCPNPNYFCHNRGRCKPEGLGKYSCLCPIEWTGPSCEFESQQTTNGEENDAGNCDLTCSNGGKCQKGKNGSLVGEDAREGDDLLQDNPSLSTDNFERCVCPQGYTGRRCEHSYHECGNGEHMCLDGAVCVPPRDVDHLWTCECDKNSGNTCNRHTSTECISPDTHKTVYRGLESLILCVNDGVCTTYNQDGRVFPACRCPPRYTGPHCEFLRDDFESTPMIVKSHESATGPIIGLIVFCALVIFFVLMIYHRKKAQTNRQKTAVIEFANLQENEERWPTTEEVDFEGTMEEVELL